MADAVQKQSQELATQLWAIANELRGNMDASKFKNYILGVIFYRYLSEKTENYMNDLLKDDGISYRDALKNEEFAQTVKEWSIEHLGYIIEPKYLWASLIDEIRGAEFSIEHFDKAISALVESTIGQESEAAFDKLFDDMNLQDKDLGKEVSERTTLIAKVMQKVDDISFNVDDAEMDVLGTAYMILISLFASDAGKKGGEFFTPTCASKLLARLATVGLDEVKNAADSCAGSGSLLLEVQNHLSTKKVGHFYATEKNGSNYNLLRMNLLMHGVPYKKFSCFNSDSIKTDNYYENGEPLIFDIQVENPPYSAKFDQSPKLLDDPRFSSCGVLAPQGKADLMFVESMVYHMSEDGRIAVLLPNGALSRGKRGRNGKKNDAEYEIRKHLIENLNVVDAVIALPPKMFHGAKLPVIVMVLKKKRNGNAGNVLFIDASKYFSTEKTTNYITDEDIDRIINAYVAREDIPKYAHVATIDEIREKNDFNCNIPRYVDVSEKEPSVDVNMLFDLVDELHEKSNVYMKTAIKNWGEKSTIDTNKCDTLLMSELFESISEKNHPEETVLTIIQGIGTVPRDNSGRKISYDKSTAGSYKLVHPNDFIMHLRSFEGGLEMATLKGIVSPAYTILRAKKPINPLFYKYYFRSDAFIKGKLSELTEGIRDGKSINKDGFWEIDVPYPSMEEQNKLAEQLANVDMWSLESKEIYDAVMQIKKGLLQQMFV